MQISFRQGIIAAQPLPPYIAGKGGNVALDASKSPVKLAFANGMANYLFIENSSVADAWKGPFSKNETYWLYWDLDLVTAQRTFGYTKVAPSFGDSFPTSPAINEHFFNTQTMKMNYFNGQGWVECIRLFAGYVQKNKVVTLSLGTQVNVNSPNSIGEILFDVNGNPLKRFVNDGSFVFLTSTDVIQPSNTNFESIKVSQLNISGKATENIPPYYCVIPKGIDNLGNVLIAKGSFFNITDGEAFAVTNLQMNPNDVRQLVTRGYLQNPSWYWDVPPHTKLYVGGDGEISTYVSNAFSSQEIGYVVNLNTIFINIQPQVIRIVPT